MKKIFFVVGLLMTASILAEEYEFVVIDNDGDVITTFSTLEFCKDYIKRQDPSGQYGYNCIAKPVSR